MLGHLDRRATVNGLIASAMLIAAIYLGSGRLKHFDPALLAYTSAVVFATFGIVYRYAVWLQKPPTGLYWRRGWHLFLRPRDLPRNLFGLAKVAWKSLVVQTFIRRRDHTRWAAHFLMSWGCLAAVAVTFPLVFGWIHFESDLKNPEIYHIYALGIPGGSFPAHSWIAWFTFHILDFCAVAVIAGMAIAMRRRMRDPGANAVQQFSMDFMPLILLFAVSVTGLMLTASVTWMKGHSYSFLSLLHAFCVIVTLLYLPFGKFFHIFQRPANMGVQYYKEEASRTEQASCARCGEVYASRMHIEDLKAVLGELGIDQSLEGGGHYQDVCPGCRRRLLAVTQLEAIGGPGFL